MLLCGAGLSMAPPSNLMSAYEFQMRAMTSTNLHAFYPAVSFAQTASPGIQAELENLHAQWLKAYDNADGTTMDHLEMDNLVLFIPDEPCGRKRSCSRDAL